MRRIAACLLLLVAGCGMTPADMTAEATAGRATVDEVFARCRAYGMSDSLIDTLLIAAEQDRDNGSTATQQFTLFLDFCGNNLLCLDCNFAVIDFVYN